MIPVSANEYLDKSAFMVRVSSLYSESSADFIKDGNPSTYWHSFYRAEGSSIVEKDSVPYYIYIYRASFRGTYIGLYLHPPN